MEGQGLMRREYGKVTLGGRNGDEEAIIGGEVLMQGCEALDASQEIWNRDREDPKINVCVYLTGLRETPGH